MFNLICGDRFKYMPQIKDKSIDLILCDLPYGALNKNNLAAQWDRQLPLKPLWEQYERIVKPNGAIILFGQGMFTAQLMMSNPRMWRYNLVWDKCATTGFLNAKRMPLRAHEDILVFYRSLPTYNAQMTKCAPHKRNHSKGNMLNPQKNSCYGNFSETPTIISDEKFPKSIISIPKEHCVGKFFHPSQKPVKLLEWLIKTYTNEGDTVLDNCMGSGSTGVAAVNTGRDFVGMELCREYFSIAEKRIKEAETKICSA